MPDPLTPNVGLSVPIRGSDVGTWDIPVNGDFTLIDSMIGGITTIAVSSSPVTLTTSQAQAQVLTFTGTLTGFVSVTLPSIYKGWMTHNQITNSPSSFCITLISTSGASIVGVPPGTTDIWYDSQTIRYRNMGKLGEYWDYAGTIPPTWVTACTIPPWLNCDGTSFSSAIYPVLANLLGTNVLPDARGRFRAALNQATGRLTAAGGGVDGNVAYAAGGADAVTLTINQIPSHTHNNSLADPGHTHTNNAAANSAGATTGGGGFPIPGLAAASINPALTGMSITNAAAGSGGSHPSIGPTYIGGITLIRA